MNYTPDTTGIARLVCRAMLSDTIAAGGASSTELWMSRVSTVVARSRRYPMHWRRDLAVIRRWWCWTAGDQYPGELLGDGSNASYHYSLAAHCAAGLKHHVDSVPSPTTFYCYMSNLRESTVGPDQFQRELKTHLFACLLNTSSTVR